MKTFQQFFLKILVLAAIMIAGAPVALQSQDLMDVEQRDADYADIIDVGGPTEVSVAYAGLPAMRWVSAYDSNWKGLHPWGAVSISIDHRFARRFWAGLSYTISSASSNDVSEGREGSATWHSLMVHGRYIYWWTGRWSFYGAVGLGVIVSYMQPSWEPTYNSTHMAFQATPIGAQFKVLDNFDLFSEAGFGVQGILKLGLRVDF